MIALALATFFISIITFIAIAIDAKRNYYKGTTIGTPALAVMAIVGSFGVVCGLLLWPVTSSQYKANRRLPILIMAAVMSVALACLGFLV